MKVLLQKGKGIGAYPVGASIMSNIDSIKKSATALKTILPKDKTIVLWCTGSSGSITATVLFMFLKNKYKDIKINYLKKDGESSHTDNEDYYVNEYNFNIVVDDFMNTGATITRIQDVLNHTKMDSLLLWCGINFECKDIVQKFIDEEAFDYLITPKREVLNNVTGLIMEGD